MSVLTITKDNFDTEVMGSEIPVLLDFWASWCGPCKMLSPIIEEVASEQTAAKVGKINIDEQPELAQSFGIMSIPTLVLIRDGKVAETSIGAKPKEDIIEMINA